MLTTSVLVLASFASAAPVPPAAAPNPHGKAFVGIQSQDEFSLVVGAILPNMPAARAGIAVGDRLLRVGSFEPIDFQQFRAHIQTYRPGATIAVEVQRGGGTPDVPRPSHGDAGPADRDACGTLPADAEQLIARPNASVRTNATPVPRPPRPRCRP